MAAKPNSGPGPVNERDRTIVRPTPLTTDVLFYEMHDSTLPKNQNREYGEAHWDPLRFPDHRLVHITPRDEKGLEKWWYAADRANQDLYNWEWSEANLGDTRFNAVKRSYVTRRDDFDPLAPTQGAAMADVPAETFDGTFILADRRQTRTGEQELDGLYVVETRLYVERVTMADVTTGQDGVATREVTTLYYRGELVGGTAIEDIFADKTLAFWELGADGYGKKGKQLTDNWFAVTETKIVSTEPEYVSSVNRLRPDSFFCPKSVTSTTVVVPNAAPGAPVAPSPASGQEITIRKKGTVEETKTVTQTGSPGSKRGTTLDERTGDTYPETIEVVPKATAGASSVNSSGIIVLYEPIDACDSAKVTRRVVDPSVREWQDVITYEWPAVLLSIEYDTYEGKNGRGSVIFPHVSYKEAYKQPQVVSVRQYWQKAAYTPVPIPALIAEGFSFACPLFSLRVSPCLHAAVTISVSIGSSDPEWENAVVTRTFAATNQTDWPATLVWSESKPFRGGYMVTEYTLPKPS